MRRIFGVILLLMGLGLAGWIGYNLLIERLPQTQDLNPAPAILILHRTHLHGLPMDARWLRPVIDPAPGGTGGRR